MLSKIMIATNLETVNVSNQSPMNMTENQRMSVGVMGYNVNWKAQMQKVRSVNDLTKGWFWVFWEAPLSQNHKTAFSILTEELILNWGNLCN